GRRIIAIAGAPASGKSTLAYDLNQQIAGSCVLPMDGFHRSNADLKQHGLLARKGAPDTFDVDGFTRVVRDVRTHADVPFPTFDRHSDRVVPRGGVITKTIHTVLVEGNYLLLSEAPWDALKSLWDFTIMLDVPGGELERRLLKRWGDHGHDADTARQKAQGNDLPNALLVSQHSSPADMTLRAPA
ncbi:MAG: phosphoribulokinase, partial [Pseudomonadota bacterium]